MLNPHPIGTPLPVPTPLSAPFWDGCDRGELRYQRCRACGGAVFNPAPVCRSCRSSDLEWTRSAGTGVLYSWTLVLRPQTPAFAVPYAPAIVTLDEGHQMISNVIGCEPDDLVTGMALTVEFHPAGGGRQLPYFAPARTGEVRNG